MKRFAGTAVAASLALAGAAAAGAPGCKSASSAPFDFDAGQLPAPTAQTLTITFTGTGTGTVTLVSDNESADGGEGGVTCSATCTQTYLSNDTVNLGANSSDDSIFDGWMPDSCSDPIGMSANVTCTVTFNLLELPDGGEDAGAEDAGGDATVDATVDAATPHDASDAGG
jgi:hypothetical protein